MIQAFLTLLFCQLAGEGLVQTLRLPVPGPVLGMIALLVYLLLRKRISPGLEVSASTLLTHLPLFFIPGGVGIMTQFDWLRSQWLLLAVSLTLSSVITLVVSGWVFQAVRAMMLRSGGAGHGE